MGGWTGLFTILTNPAFVSVFSECRELLKCIHTVVVLKKSEIAVSLEMMLILNALKTPKKQMDFATHN